MFLQSRHIQPKLFLLFFNSSSLTKVKHAEYISTQHNLIGIIITDDNNNAFLRFLELLLEG